MKLFIALLPVICGVAVSITAILRRPFPETYIRFHRIWRVIAWAVVCLVWFVGISLLYR